MTAKEAVEQSISHDTITGIEASDKAEAKALIAELEAIAAEADLDFDWTDSNEGYETWAMEDGSVNGGPMAWRVHIAVVAQ